MQHVITEKSASAGLITLARPRALNALSLEMIRSLTAALLHWRDDRDVHIVAVRGVSKHASDPTAQQPFGAFCAGGDIRFFHQAALAGDPALEDFFTEEYRLNHLIHRYPKPVVAFMDGIVMGGGMGIAQGARLRIATERTKMAMPETGIGLFPDVGGGFFMSRCPGHLGEYLALTGCVLDGHQAFFAGLADHVVAADVLPGIWAAIADGSLSDEAMVSHRFAAATIRGAADASWPPAAVDGIFGLPGVREIMHALQARSADDPWARETAAVLARRSPLMLHVTLEQIRRARGMDLATELRMERDLVHRCFHPMHLGRSGAELEVVEGVRALAVDKDHQPRWNPPTIDAVQADMVAPFFDSPWSVDTHPLRDLA